MLLCPGIYHISRKGIRMLPHPPGPSLTSLSVPTTLSSSSSPRSYLHPGPLHWQVLHLEDDPLKTSPTWLTPESFGSLLKCPDF